MKQGTELFRESIRSVLVERCLQCHGGEKVRADFDLSTRKLLLDSGYVDLNDAESSYLLELVNHVEEPHMPPTGDKLSDAVIKDLTRWIELGAPYDKPLVRRNDIQPRTLQVTDSDREFWSFKPLASAEPPVDQSDWSRNDIDRFIRAKQLEAGVAPNAPAESHARIRRAYLDVIGLPPTPQQLEAALELSHGELIDELLESPHYGERWARHWLDAARFAESHGFEQDYDRRFAFHYRDFVIKAFNADMPWNQFVRWQIAGDELAPNDPLALMATGFLGAGVFPTQLTEKEFESARYDELDDMAATVGTAMLGLTIGCARCHDHKFDPIPAQDYYRFVSTFTTTIRSEIDVPADLDQYNEELIKWNVAHNKLEQRLEDYQQSDQFQDQFLEWLSNDAESVVQQSRWNILNEVEVSSDQAATKFSVQKDGSVLATGNAPAKEVYIVRASPNSKEIASIRIEALTDKSMNRGGPGRASNGNFALSNLQIFIIKDPESKERKELQLRNGRATHQQNETNLSVASAIDDDPAGTGWAVDFGGIGSAQAAVFELANPLKLDADVTLELRLTFANNAKHSLGKFRLSISGSPSPRVSVGDGTSSRLNNAIAALRAGTLSDEQRETLLSLFAQKDSTWTELSDAVISSSKTKPKPEVIRVQVSSEGFPPVKHHADGRGFPHFYPETHFLNRGDPNQKQGVAKPGYLTVLMRGGKSNESWNQAPPQDWERTSYRRASMANWITDVDYGAGHLLARVAVNRIWHHHFGQGIVSTPNDFGLQGAPPTHPELLDYLANKLIQNNWSIKSLHREILTSATWLQSSELSDDKRKIDPQNKLLWRFPTRRLEAEIVRDSMLAVSGNLDTKQFGPGTLNPAHRRRSIYFMIKRSRLIPMMQVFDQPEPLSSQGNRPSTTIAPQALLVMNNSQILMWAKAFAKSVVDLNDSEAIAAIYLKALSRKASDWELTEGVGFLEEQAKSYLEAGFEKDASRQQALADFCHITFGLNEFVYLP